MRQLLIITLTAFLLSACSLPKLKIPRVHKVPVQQGNVITQEMVDRLKPGMTRSQVAFIMGEPILRSTFSSERWDYFYSFEIPGVYDQDTRVTLFFENDVLAYFTGDLAPTSAQENEQDSANETAADAVANEQASIDRAADS